MESHVRGRARPSPLVAGRSPRPARQRAGDSSSPALAGDAGMPRRCVSHRCGRAFCRGGSFSISQGQIGFGSHLGSIANRLFLYTFGIIVGDTHKFQSRATGVQLLQLLPAVGRWKMDCDGYPRIPMPLMCTAFVPGQIDAAVAGISDPDSRTIATAEALYFRGQATLAAKTARPYLDAPIPHCAIPHALSADMPVCRSTVSPTPAGALLASSIRQLTRNRPPSTPRISCSSRPRVSCCTCLPRILLKSFIHLRRICPKACAYSPAT